MWRTCDPLVIVLGIIKVAAGTSSASGRFFWAYLYVVFNIQQSSKWKVYPDFFSHLCVVSTAEILIFFLNTTAA